MKKYIAPTVYLKKMAYETPLAISYTDNQPFEDDPENNFVKEENRPTGIWDQEW